MRSHLSRAIALTLFAGLVVGCKTETTSNTPTPYVLTTSLEQGAYLQWHLNGQVVAQNQTQLSFQIGGQVTERLVNPGDQVKTGQVLFKLDPTDNRLKQRAAEASLRATEAELTLAQTEAQRTEDLLKRKLVSQQDVDRAQNQVTTLRQRQTAQQRELELVLRQLSYTELKAPADGVIQSVEIDLGQVVQPGLVVAQLIMAPRDVLVEVPENRIHTLPQTAQVTFHTPQPQTFNLPLRELTPQSQASSRTWQARFALPPEATAQLGQTARLSFGEHSVLYKVPLSAIFEQAQGAHIWLVKQNQVTLQPVVIKQLAQDYALIEADIPANSTLVKAGVHLLKPGLVVQERKL